MISAYSKITQCYLWKNAAPSAGGAAATCRCSTASCMMRHSEVQGTNSSGGIWAWMAEMSTMAVVQEQRYRGALCTIVGG